MVPCGAGGEIARACSDVPNEEGVAMKKELIAIAVGLLVSTPALAD
jgi:hypothetical protein